ncbi:MAG TPA: type II toxin-antitoxin system HicA family toxin [Thermoanaerobaculia bacterium]|nr:type II toxin-antitoxin system HicA family toxin [Thermoanaerobaculia bacterium]
MPRDVSGDELARRLARYGYAVSRQTGSHMRLTTSEPSEHHVTIPRHNPLSLGTLRSVLTDVAAHLAIPRDELVIRLFG